MLKRLLLLFASVFLVAQASGEETGLKRGERIVFLGDSITQAGAGPKGYVTVVKNFLSQHHADLEIEVLNAGISGHRVPDLQKRVETDVLSKDPTLVVIYIGINDVWHSQNGRGTSKDAYESGLRDLIKRIRAKGARVILCTPSLIGEKNDDSNSLDPMLDEYCDISRAVARATGTQLLDLHDSFTAYVRQNNPGNASNNILTTDGVHLNDAGNQFVAARMLKALDAKPRPTLFRHVVLFQFKEGVSEGQVQEVIDAFRNLRSQIPTIVDFESGIDASVEGKADGFTHGFVVSFRDAAGRDAYLPHPAHQEFVKLVGPRLEKVLVFDYAP